MEENNMNDIIIRNEEEELKEEVKVEVKEEVKVDLVAKKKKDNDLILSAITVGAGAILAGLLVYRELKKKPKIDVIQTGKDVLEKIKGRV